MPTPILGAPTWTEGQALPATKGNEIVSWLEFFAAGGNIKDRDLTAPPGSPSDGDGYLIKATATGAWAGHDDHIALLVNGAWVYITPKEGMRLWVDDETIDIRYVGVFGSGGAWTTVAVSVTFTGDLVILDGDALSLDPYATFYVDSVGGSDSNNGQTSGTAWQTLEYALAFINRLRWANETGFPALELATGSYDASSFMAYDGAAPALGIDGISIYSATGLPADVTIDCGSLNYYASGGQGTIYFEGITFDNIHEVKAFQGAVLDFTDCDFNVVGTNNRVFHTQSGGEISLHGNITVDFASSTQYALFSAADNSHINTTAAFTITGSPAFSIATCIAENGSVVNGALTGATTFSGTVTGSRFYLLSHGTIYTNGGGTSYFPGDSAGSKDSTSFYDEGPGAGGTFSGALVTKSIDQTLANYTTAAAVAWDTEVYDTGGFHDTVTNNSRLTIPSGVSYVQLTAAVQVDLNSSGFADIYVYKNGNQTWQGRAAQRNGLVSSTTNLINLSTPVLPVTAGDYFELYLRISSDTSVSVLKDISWFALEVKE